MADSRIVDYTRTTVVSGNIIDPADENTNRTNIATSVNSSNDVVTDLEQNYASATAPTSIVNGKIWYSTESGQAFPWIRVSSAWKLMAFDGMTTAFAFGDGLTVVSNFAVSGASTLNSLAVTSNAALNGTLTVSGAATFNLAAGISVDTISEVTATTGVAVDGVLLKDGEMYGDVHSTAVLKDGVTATTQSDGDNSTLIATTEYADQAALGAGTILQMIQDLSTTTQQQSTDETWVAVTDLSKAITPANTANHVGIFVSLSASNDSVPVMVRLMRDSTPIMLGAAAGDRIVASGAIPRTHAPAQAGPCNISLSFIDSPAATIAVTYSVQIWHEAGNTYVNRSSTDTDTTLFARTVSSIVLFEYDKT